MACVWLDRGLHHGHVAVGTRNSGEARNQKSYQIRSLRITSNQRGILKYTIFAVYVILCSTLSVGGTSDGVWIACCLRFVYHSVFLGRQIQSFHKRFRMEATRLDFETMSDKRRFVSVSENFSPSPEIFYPTSIGCANVKAINVLVLPYCIPVRLRLVRLLGGVRTCAEEARATISFYLRSILISWWEHSLCRWIRPSYEFQLQWDIK